MLAKEISTCHICDSSKFRKIEYPGPSKASEIHFSFIYICENCGFGQATPIYNQNELNRFYTSGKYWNSVTLDKDILNYYAAQSKYRLKKLTHYLSNKNTLDILDIGSGSGLLAKQLGKSFPRKKINYFYVELDEKQSLDILITKNLVITKIATLPSVTKMDIVFANQVMEHVSNPTTFLEEIIDSMNEDAIAYIEVPNLDYQFKNDVFPHCNFFSRDSLYGLSQKKKLNTIEITSFGSHVATSANILQKIKRKTIRIFIKISTWLKLPTHFLYNFIFQFTDKQDGPWNYFIFSKPK